MAFFYRNAQNLHRCGDTCHQSTRAPPPPCGTENAAHALRTRGKVKVREARGEMEHVGTEQIPDLQCADPIAG